MNVGDSQTVEQVHHDDHHEKDKDGKDEVAHPVGDVDVRVVHLPREHDDSFHQGEPNVSEMIRFLRSTRRGTRSIRRLGVVGSKYESEWESEAEEEGKVGEEDEGVALEDGGEHVDVEGDGGVGDDLDEEEVELHEGEQEGEGSEMSLHHLTLSKSNPLFRQKGEDDEAKNDPFDEVFKIGEVSANQRSWELKIQWLFQPFLQFDQLVYLPQYKNQRQYTDDDEGDGDVVALVWPHVHLCKRNLHC